MIDIAVLIGAKTALALSATLHGGALCPTLIHMGGYVATRNTSSVVVMRPVRQTAPAAEARHIMMPSEFADHSSAQTRLVVAGVRCTIHDVTATAALNGPAALTV